MATVLHCEPVGALVLEGVEPVLHQDRALAAPLTGTVFEGRAARTHTELDPLVYATGPEYRDMSELRRIAEQLPGTVLTLDHPNDLIRNGAQARIIGEVLTAKVVDDHVVVRFIVTDEHAIAVIRAGVVELSLGYQSVLDQNRFQRQILIDHLAVVPRARCGPTCKLRADCMQSDTSGCGCPSTETIAVSTEPEHVDEIPNEHQPGCGCGGNGHDTCACKIRAVQSDDMSAELNTKLDEANAALDAARNELSAVKGELDTVKAELSTTKTQLDAANAQIETLKSAAPKADVTEALANLDAAKTKAEIEADNAKANLAQVQTQLDAAKAEIETLKTQKKNDADDAFNARVDARVEVLAAAQAVGIENAKTMSDRDIKVAIIKHVDSIDVPAEKSMDYVDGVFAGAMDRFGKSAASVTETRQVINQQRQDGVLLAQTAREAELAARAENNNRMGSAWMTPAGKN